MTEFSHLQKVIQVYLTNERKLHILHELNELVHCPHQMMTVKILNLKTGAIVDGGICRSNILFWISGWIEIFYDENNEMICGEFITPKHKSYAKYLKEGKIPN